ncbi:MAG: hypothetical protein MZW92_45880 [Comamonadaceae bacterium]|nr:hypothetical protein [Comamonadaceae bacterium]
MLLKRGFGITLDESLNAAEYLASEGNRTRRVRPARHEDQHGRPAPQLRRLRARAGGQAPDAHAGVHRPVALGGLARARARTACSTSCTSPPRASSPGANMILVDFHPEPAKALVDGPQALLRSRSCRGSWRTWRIAREAYEKRRARAARVAVSF